MARSVNKVFLTGNLGADPKIISFDNGGNMATASMAVGDGYKDKDGNWKDITYWHDLVFFGQQVDVVEKYLKKGSSIHIEGKLTKRKWNDKEGNTRYAVEVNVQVLTMLDKKSNSNSGGAPPPPAGPPGTEEPQSERHLGPDDDLPF